MQISRRDITIGLAALCAAHALPALAHTEKSTVSKVEWSEKDGFLYVTHMFHLHNTEVVLFKAGITQSAKFESLRARAQLALYVEDRFTLKSLEGELIPLDILGAEIEGRDVYVYQQVKLKTAPTGLIVDCNMLRDIVPEQVNHVDVKLMDETRSLAFRTNDGIKIVKL